MINYMRNAITAIVLSMFMLSCDVYYESSGVSDSVVNCDPSVDASLSDASLPDASPPDAMPPPPPVHVFRKFYLLGDSIPVYGASDVAHRAASLLAASYPGSFVNQAIGGKALWDYMSTPSLHSATVANIVASNPSEIYIQLGYNDQPHWVVTDFAAAYNTLTAELHASLPDLIIYCQALIPTGGRVDPYSNAIRTNCHGTVVEPNPAFGFVRPTDFLDAVHFVNSGHAKLAAGIRLTVGW